jgi:hypothetical protein
MEADERYKIRVLTLLKPETYLFFIHPFSSAALRGRFNTSSVGFTLTSGFSRMIIFLFSGFRSWLFMFVSNEPDFIPSGEKDKGKISPGSGSLPPECIAHLRNSPLG